MTKDQNITNHQDDGSGKKTLADRVTYVTNHPSDSYPAESSFDKLWGRIQVSQEKRTKNHKISWWGYAAVAASITILLIAGFWFISRPVQSPNVYTLSVENGRQQFTLPDGTLVWLNSNSKLTYNDHFGIKTREVELSGEVYFEVVKDRERPFVVKAEELDVKVLGTSFDVFTNHEAITTTLVEGSVSIRKASGNETETILRPGQQLQYDKKNNQVTIYDVDVNQFIAWKDGKLIFRNDPFESVLSVLEHNYQVIIILKNMQLSQRKITGRFDLENSIDDVFAIMKETMNFEYHRQDNMITIK